MQILDFKAYESGLVCKAKQSPIAIRNFQNKLNRCKIEEYVYNWEGLSGKMTSHVVTTNCEKSSEGIVANMG